MSQARNEAIQPQDSEEHPEDLTVQGKPLVLNDTIRLLLQRKSIRAWDVRKPIPDEVLNTILWAGTRASSSGQTYAIIDVRDPQRKKKLARYALQGRRGKFVQNWIEKAPVVLVFCVDLRRGNRYMELTTGTPLPLGHLSLCLSIVEMSICLQNVITAATSFGIGSVICGNVILEARRAGQLLRLPKGVVPVIQLPIGYPRKVPRRYTVRLPVEAVTHRETYREATDDDLFHWYEDHQRAFLELMQGDITASERLGHNFAEIVKRMRGKKDPGNWAQLTTEVIYPREDLVAASQEVWAAVKEAGFADE